MGGLLPASVRPGQGVRGRRRRCRDRSRRSSCRAALSAGAFVTVPATWQGPKSDSNHAPRRRARRSRGGRRLARACARPSRPAGRRPRRCPTGVDRCRPVRTAVGRSARPLRPDHGARSARHASTRRSSACDQVEDARRRLGAVGARFEGIAANTRGWLLRNVGCGGLADESNEQALAAHAEQARLSEIGLTEAYWVAQLDLIDGRLLAGDLDGASGGSPTTAGLDEWKGTMAWHQRHRLGLLRARAQIMGGEPESAWPLADAVRADASERGARRYELLASALIARCDPSSDIRSVATDRRAARVVCPARGVAPGRRAGTSVRRRRMDVRGRRTHSGVGDRRRRTARGDGREVGGANAHRGFDHVSDDHRANQCRCRRRKAGGRLLDESARWSLVERGDEWREVRHSQPPGDEVAGPSSGNGTRTTLPCAHPARRRGGEGVGSAWRAGEQPGSGARRTNRAWSSPALHTPGRRWT